VIVPREIFGDGKAEVFGVVNIPSARLFADDCLLYRPIKTEADATKLQEDIDALQNLESTSGGVSGEDVGGELYRRPLRSPEVRHISVGPYQGRLQGLVQRESAGCQ
jgi:hypothetical protein